MNEPMTLDELLDDDGILAEVRRVASRRRRLQVVRFGFGQAKLGIGPKHPLLRDVDVYDDTWDFPNPKAALLALETWNPEETAEPTGWHRHVSTGRFRIRGDAKLASRAETRITAANSFTFRENREWSMIQNGDSNASYADSGTRMSIASHARLRIDANGMQRIKRRKPRVIANGITTAVAKNGNDNTDEPTKEPSMLIGERVIVE